MLIDWFTVGAQVLNFLILVWLLKRFLYKPILNAVNTREARIKKERADADKIKTEAEAARDEFQKKNDAFAKQHAALLQKAKDEVAAERQRLMTEATDAADALTAKRAKALQAEASALDKSVADRARDEVFAIARKTLKDLADVSLEDRMCDAFVDRIKALDNQPGSALSKAIQATSDPILLRSVFDLSKAQHAAIQSALHKIFETDPALIGGIELTVGGQKLAWSISDYLSSLKTSVDAVLSANEHAKASPKGDAKAVTEPDKMEDIKPAAKAGAKAGAKIHPKPKRKSDKAPEKTSA
jgi:F-type H+-transporting ATPase subunit b